jgi:steroid delta-isomerase-like uncharacterized protein
MSTEENMALVCRVYQDAFNKGNLEAIDEVTSANYVCHFMQTEFGREGLKRNVVALRAAFPDLQVTVEDISAMGDRVTHRYTIRGTHQGMFMGVPATGKQVTFTGIMISRCTGSQVVEDWECTDMPHVMQQLGLVSPSGEG